MNHADQAFSDINLSRSTSASDEASLNDFDTFDADEVEGVALLRQIFPEESTESLKRLHRERVSRPPQHASTPPLRPVSPPAPTASKTPRSKLGQRIQREQSHSWKECLLPHDFLRLPPHVAVRRLDGETGQWHYQLLDDLAKRAVAQYERLRPSVDSVSFYYTRALYRDAKVGLGLSLFEQNGVVRVHSLTRRDGQTWLASPETTTKSDGPAIQAGILPGDVLIGINGTALHQSVGPNDSLVKHAVGTIQQSPDPVVLHLLRGPANGDRLSGNGVLQTPKPVDMLHLDHETMTPSLLDATNLLDNSRSVEVSFNMDQIFHSTPMIDDVVGTPLVHPFVATLRSHGLIQAFEDERRCTMMLAQFTERTRQWEATSSFQLDSYPKGSEVFIPLMGVRKALCVRILNTFLDGTNSAYTIWVYDVESGREWYAPVRYLKDFQDLRSATMRLNPAIGMIPFPKQSLSIFGSPVRQDTSNERECKCRQLESFLRLLCSMIYREPLHPAVAEIAVHVQSFLGCGNELEGTFGDGVGLSSSSWQTRPERVRYVLKRSLQRYTYRLFLLDPLRSVADTFIDAVRARGPKLEDLETLEAQGRSVLKERAMKDLHQMKSFLDRLQNLVLEGCMGDFRSIAEREDYEAIHPVINSANGDSFLDRLVREAVREQIEIEVYVPLRSVVSRWLVNGWRHEDMEVQFKIRELRKRPQKNFRIPEEKMSPSSYATVSNILKEGVGMSTLPCIKLRCIVEAAREISRLFSSEHETVTVDTGELGSGGLLGADDFLPIFIFCVVQAEMERPCALCVLLRTLCDPINRMGEIGYYLASFEAAISHIQEVDLTEDLDEMLSFLSIPLNDSS